MILSALLCLLVASIASAVPLSEPKVSGGCPGGYAEGAEIERGRLIFVCQGGQVVPKGCIAEDLSRLSVGGTYDKKNYRMKCEIGSDGQLSFVATGCLFNGQEHKADDTFDDGKKFYACKTDGDNFKVVVQGCIDSGKRVPLKETVAKDDSLYSCDEAVNDGAELVPAGCVKDGKQYKAGESFDDGKFWYNCTRTGRTKVVAKAAGCMFGGKRLNDGDRYTDNGVFYECMADKLSVRATGCAQNDGSNVIERRLGCTWTEGQAPLQYEVQCKHDTAKDTAIKVQIRCEYNVGGGFVNMDAGCYRKVDDKTFAGCSQAGENMLKLQAYSDEQSATGAGLHAC